MPMLSCPTCRQMLAAPDGVPSFRCPKCGAVVEATARRADPDAVVSWKNLATTLRMLGIAMWVIAALGGLLGMGLSKTGADGLDVQFLVSGLILALALDRIAANVIALRDPRNRPG